MCKPLRESDVLKRIYNSITIEERDKWVRALVDLKKVEDREREHIEYIIRRDKKVLLAIEKEEEER